jgi:uncharacterized protein (DUF885 family)
MLNRRHIFLSAAATAAVAPFSSALAQAAKAAVGSPHDKLFALFDAFMDENLRAAPEFATSLGVDVGDKAAERGKLSDNSLAGIARINALNASQLRRLKAFDRSSLSPADKVSYDIILYGWSTRTTPPGASSSPAAGQTAPISSAGSAAPTTARRTSWIPPTRSRPRPTPTPISRA